MLGKGDGDRKRRADAPADDPRTMTTDVPEIGSFDNHDWAGNSRDGSFCPAKGNMCIGKAFCCTKPMVSDNQAAGSAVGAALPPNARLFERAFVREESPDRSRLTCGCCTTTFDSRNRFFDHLRQERHTIVSNDEEVANDNDGYDRTGNSRGQDESTPQGPGRHWVRANGNDGCDRTGNSRGQDDSTRQGAGRHRARPNRNDDDNATIDAIG